MNRVEETYKFHDFFGTVFHIHKQSNFLFKSVKTKVINFFTNYSNKFIKAKVEYFNLLEYSGLLNVLCLSKKYQVRDQF